LASNKKRSLDLGEPQRKAKAKKLQASERPAHIMQTSKGYKVVLAWNALSVSTGITSSLAQAVDWQIALLWVRGVAQARVRRLTRRGTGGSIGKNGAKNETVDAVVDPLTEDELLQLLEGEPGIELTFTAVVQVYGVKGRQKQFAAPAAADLQVALDARRQLLVAARSRRPEDTLRAAQRTAGEVVRRSMQQHRKRVRLLIQAVQRELKARNALMEICDHQAAVVAPKNKATAAAAALSRGGICQRKQNRSSSSMRPVATPARA
jgi:hypothetical protein